MPSLFELQRSQLLNRWGDYGDVLCNGLCLSERSSEQLRLGRAGPFVPPISFPGISGSVVVTSAARRQIESTRLTGIGEFRLVVPEKVVAIEWHKWDRNEELKGALLPFNGEPEEYVLHNPHDGETASQVEQLWTWHPAQIGRVVRSHKSMRLEGVLGKLDVFRLCDNNAWRKILVNDRGKQAISRVFGEWVTFDEVAAVMISS